MENLVDCLAGTANPQQDLLADLVDREAACALLTRDQADVLDRLVYLRAWRRREWTVEPTLPDSTHRIPC